MRISLNWIKKFVKIPVSDEELVRLIGARLVEVEGVIDETHKYDHIYIVRVESAEKIPGTHLTKCMINVGAASFRELPEVTTEDEGASPVTTGASDSSRERSRPTLVQVMCGAPNVREGMLAVWIAPGAVVPASVNETAPFVIGKRKMLGKYDSYGMLAGADELDLGDDHSGIVEIDPKMAAPGDLFADVFELNDLILDIENKSLTHRPDCFGIVGFAREVAGILGEMFEEGAFDALFQVKTCLPEMSYAGTPAEPSPSETNLSGPSGIYISGRANLKIDHEKAHSNALRISIQSPDICSRYSAITLEKHGELKKKYLTWEDTMICKAGMRPVEPIVDATNYLMLLTGQPLHAFDYDKFVKVGGGEKAEINVRLAKDGERLTLLDGKEVDLNTNDIVICSKDTPVALAGAMGGESTEIDKNTKKIIIESATFSLYHLRKTQMAHGIFSEAITRFTKGQPSYQTLYVAGECAEMLSHGFKVAGVADKIKVPEEEIVVKITTNKINGLLGTEYADDLIIKTLENVGFEVKAKDSELAIKVPAWRTDIHIPEDIIEEIGRLLGYDNIKPVLPLHGTADKNAMFEMKRKIRDTMSSFGANEILTYSFVSVRLLKKVGQEPKNSYRIINSISPELQYVRQSIMPSLLDKAYMNEKLPVEKMAIFEINKVYQRAWGETEEKVPVEKMHLGIVIAERKNLGTAYYKARKYVDGLLGVFGITAEYRKLKSDAAEAKMLEKKRAAEIVVDGTVIGVIGELRNVVKHDFKLGDYTAGAELNLELVQKYAGGTPTIEFGETKAIDETIETKKTYAETLKEAQKKYKNAKISPVSIYQARDSEIKKITFHIVQND